MATASSNGGNGKPCYTAAGPAPGMPGMLEPEGLPSATTSGVL